MKKFSVALLAVVSLVFISGVFAHESSEEIQEVDRVGEQVGKEMTATMGSLRETLRENEEDLDLLANDLAPAKEQELDQSWAKGLKNQ